MANDISIQAEVSKISEGIPATDFIKSLLKFIVIDAAAYQRDVMLAHQVFYRSRVAYEAIGTLANAVEQAAAPDWESFDKYAGAILPLERLLLQFYAKNAEDKSRNHLPPQPPSPLDAITFIAGWKEDRKMLAEVLDGLANNDIACLSEDVRRGVSASRQDARTSDDKATISALYNYLRTNNLNDRSIVQPRNGRMIVTIKESIRQIQAKVLQAPPREETSAMVITSFMLIYIPFSLVLAPTTEKEWKEYLKGEEIWKAVLSLAAKLLAHLNSTAVVLAEVEQEWSKLEALLLKTSVHDIDTLAEMLELIRLAAKIRRPFHGRTVELIRMIHRLDTYSSNRANNVGMHRKALKDLMQDSIEAIEKTAKEVTDVQAIATTSPAYQTHAAAFQKILDGVQETFKAVKLEGEWDVKDKSYKTAAKVDEDHLNNMRRRLGLDGPVSAGPA
ncbi:hypothetical protein NLJ89_g4505 [Agrocybe chaxingu]|uniref:Uncharacterized protein n=1 Tax=Agrocybe chaxingu TaxID=84603 RepID=A0A9W8K2T5_9AGAR|nr:hypothetical protein NLJ89_g4505 [Agrocybe chaxingu]